MGRLAVSPLLALLLLLPAVPHAQENRSDKPSASPAAPEGIWKVLVPFVGEDGAQAKWLLRFEQKDGAWTGSVLAVAEGWSKTTLENLVVEPNRLRFLLRTATLSLSCDLRIPKDPRVDKLYGMATVRKRATPLELERTTLTSLTSFDQLRDLLAKQPLGHEAVQTALRLLGQAEARKAKPAEVRSWAEKAIRSADLYGPAFQRDILLLVSQILGEEKGYEAIALQYARRAERLLEPKESPQAQKRVLDVLAGVLERAGKDKDAKEIQDRLAKLNFDIKPLPFAGRKAKSDRVVLVELFTGAQCPPCVAADLAFDALGKSFKPQEVVLLQYHLHVPGPDPLTNPDAETRSRFYEEAVRGTPTILINGRPGPEGGGAREDAPDKFEEYVEAITPLLEQQAKASLKLTASRKDDKIDISVEVDKLATTGEDVRLRLVLVEQEVLYKGSNGLTTHHHVVRAMPGGPDGTPLPAKSLKKNFTVQVEQLKKQLKDYLDKYEQKRPFPGKERPLELKNLKVVAFIQNDMGGEVLQAAQVSLAE